MGRLFGTDGVRGVANADLTAELALGLSVAAAHVLAEAGTFEGHRPMAVVGRDPRASGEFLEAAVVAGLASAGVDVLRVGVLPTPAVAYLTGALGADLGVMLSASHNPMPDNGIKFFARGGHKLADELEDRIEARLRASTAPASRGSGRPAPGSAGSRDYDGGLRPLRRPPRRRPAQPARRAEGRRRRRARRRRPGLARRRSRGPAPRSSRSAPSRTASTSTTAAAPPTSARCRPPSSSTAPTSASPTTATPTAAWPWTRAGDEVDGDQILAVLALAMREAGTLREDTVVAHRDVQPRLQARHGARGRRARPDRGRRPLRPGGDEGARLRPRRRAVRARHRPRPRHDRRRHAHRPAAGGPGRRHRPYAGRPRRRSWSGCRRC